MDSITDRIRAAIATLKDQGKPFTLADVARVANTKLGTVRSYPELCNEALAAIAAIEQKTSAGDDRDSIVIEALRQEEQACLEQLKRLEAEREQLTEDREIVLRNLAAIKRVISLKTGVEPSLEMELVATHTGHQIEVVSNGRHGHA